ncbi:LamB/YcsF family protein [Acinetobacter brisouii]|uniref:LamB/YcsF family protein n=1 Tax=Acinetobacter brisouii TaxID=396323 RepID=UPI00124FE052|nr:5-oxoprolinase subunit PxpA [Acinetobacter brisouii]
MQIDLNSDLGESYGAWQMGNDALILPVVSSANIACGFHAGDPAGIFKTLKQAAACGVNVGAHVSYPDLVGFGRRNMDVSYDELLTDVMYQVAALQGLAKAAGTQVTYVKPHGALYNTIAHNLQQAKAVIDAMQLLDPKLILVGLAGSALIEFAQQQGVMVIAEAFADRAYNADGSLVSRRLAGAVLHDVEEIAARVVSLIQTGGVTSIDGQFTPIQAQSICLHGDTQGAVEMAQAIRQRLEQAGIQIQAFASQAEG